MKKGFTLIELLAVIIILVIIILIIMPVIINIVDNVRKGAFENSARGLSRVVENDCLRKSIGEEHQGYFVFLEGEVINEELIFSGKENNFGIIWYDNNCKIAMMINNGKWCALKSYNENNIIFSEYDGECILEEMVVDGIPPEVLISQGFVPISTPDELNNIRYDTLNTFGLGTEWEGTYTGGLDKKYFQTNDIDLDVAPYNSGTGWETLGRIASDNGNYFMGIYNGQDYIIENLYISWSSSIEDCQLALFYGIDEEGIVQNVKVNSFSVTGAFELGAIAVYNEGLIENVDVVGVVNMLLDWQGNAGGIVWENLETGRIINVSADVFYTGHHAFYVGGIVGWNDGEIFRAKARGTINTSGLSMDIGGITGRNQGLIKESFSNLNIPNQQYMYFGGVAGDCHFGTIENSYSTGTIHARYDSRGFCGYGIDTVVLNGYSVGSVIYSGSGDPNTVSGFIGGSISNTIITNSYWDTETSGQSTSDGGEGRTTADMTYPYNSSNTYIDWDFENVWAIDASIDNGYPYLIHNPPFD